MGTPSIRCVVLRRRAWLGGLGALVLASAARAADAVRIGQATTSLSFLPIWAARALDTFGKEGLALDWATIPGGDPATLAALDGGDIDLAAVGGDTALAAIGRGQPFQVVASLMDRVSLDLVVSTSFLARAGVAPADPLEKRLAALRGAVVGVSAVGGAQDRAVRWLAARGGVDPKAVQVAMVGGPPALQAALENARIDAFILSPPEAQVAEAAGAGRCLVGMSQDFPELRAVPFLVLVAKVPVADPARTTRALRALAAGSAAVTEAPDAVADAIRAKFFPKSPPAIIRDGVAALREGVAARGALDAARADAMLRFARESGIDVGRIGASGAAPFWTDAYVAAALR